MPREVADALKKQGRWQEGGPQGGPQGQAPAASASAGGTLGPRSER